MRELADMRCVPCSGDVPRLSEIEIRELQELIPDWHLVEQDGVQRLERSYRFREYKSGLEFTLELGKLADSEGHHPAILTEYEATTVTWWTHVINGLHRNDFIMAARADRLFRDREARKMS